MWLDARQLVKRDHTQLRSSFSFQAGKSDLGRTPHLVTRYGSSGSLHPWAVGLGDCPTAAGDNANAIPGESECQHKPSARQPWQFYCAKICVPQGPCAVWASLPKINSRAAMSTHSRTFAYVVLPRLLNNSGRSSHGSLC